MNIVESKLIVTLITFLASLSFSKYAMAIEVTTGEVTKPCVSYSESESNIIGFVSAGRTKAPNFPPLLTDKFAFFHIHLEVPMCIDAGANEDGLEPAYERIEHFELGITNAEEYRSIRQFVGKRVRCTGKFSPAITGFHWDDVILWNPLCAIIRINRDSCG